MGLIERNREPTPLELRVFGLVVFAICGIIGGIVLARSESTTAAGIIWCVGLAIATVYYAVPAIRRTIYFAWMTVFYPLGWLVSHAMLAIVYYLVLTPIGLLARLFGHDPLCRSYDRDAKSYWTTHPQETDTNRYFSQF